MVDGTMIPSGQYRVYLEVRCTDGAVQAVDERILEVNNEVKLGDLNLAFNDLDVHAGRRSDTTDSNLPFGTGRSLRRWNGRIQSDFSPGWNLSLLNASITLSHREGVTTQLGQPWADGTRVLVTLPDQTEYWFTFDPIQVGSTGVFLPYLNPDPDNAGASLYVQDVDDRLRFFLDSHRNDGTYLSNLNGLASIPANFGSAFILESEVGLKYQFDIHSGQLISIADQNDAQVDILEAGTNLLIQTRGTGSDNRVGQPALDQVVILRDSDHRITGIEDLTIEIRTERSSTNTVTTTPIQN